MRVGRLAVVRSQEARTVLAPSRAPYTVLIEPRALTGRAGLHPAPQTSVPNQAP